MFLKNVFKSPLENVSQRSLEKWKWCGMKTFTSRGKRFYGLRVKEDDAVIIKFAVAYDVEKIRLPRAMKRNGREGRGEEERCRE